MAYDTDVLVIGAGPAGLAAARKLSMADADFLLAYREKSPCENKVCGGFIPGRALERFGISDLKGSHPINGVRMTFPGVETTTVDFEHSVGVNATRYDIGRAQLAQINKLTRIWPDTKATYVAISSERCQTSFVKGDVSGVIKSKLLIDASGVNPVSQRFTPIRSRISNSSMGYAVQYQMRVSATSEPLEGINDFVYGSEFSPGGYAWAFPRGREVAVGTGGLIERVRRSERRMREYLEHLLANHGPIRNHLADASAFRVEAALMPLAGIVRPSYSPRLMLAGDAAGHCSPITGEGIFYSMIAGEMAAMTAIEALRKDDYSSDVLKKYEVRWNKEFGSDLKWGLWLQKRLLNGGSSSLGSKFLDSEKSRRNIAEMILGIRSVRSAISRAIPSYLLSRF